MKSKKVQGKFRETFILAVLSSAVICLQIPVKQSQLFFIGKEIYELTLILTKL